MQKKKVEIGYGWDTGVKWDTGALQLYIVIIIS